MSAEYIQLVGTDVPGSYGSCCFSGQVQHEALRCPPQPLTVSDASPTPSSGAATAMNGDGQLLFFNCPEGTQRFSSEANVRLVRTRGFFFTRWAASAVMGMPGLLFTINDAGVRHANFFGPSSRCLAAEGAGGTHTQRSPSGAGLEGMLEALRLHYFWHRAMSFQQLRAGAVLRQLPTALPWNYVCEVPLCPVGEEGEGGASAQPRDMSSSSSASSFFVLALLLSPTSALLGFRVSREASTSSEEETYGYAILHAPRTCFDPQRAKALGVPPGPMYGRLKQGIGVWIDDERSPSCGATSAEKSRRFIYPHSVKQATVGSRCIYVSLVLDGDDGPEVAAALETLFGRDAPANCGDPREEGVTPAVECERLRRGELRRFLARWRPSLLFCDNDHAASGEATAAAQPPMERTVVLTHVVHVQRSDFFAPFAAGTTGAAEAHYIMSIFARVQRGVRVQAVQSVCNDRRGGDSAVAAGATMGTTHHFCAAVQQRFSAFPTALAHRYHLNCIAGAQFPITLPSAEDEERGGMKEGAGRIWPYAVKHPLIPPEAATPIPPNTHTLAATGPAFDVAMSSSLVPGSRQQKKKGGNLKKEDVSGLLRYPTARSAVDMLSAEFRSAASKVHGQMQLVLPALPSSPFFHTCHRDSHDDVHGTRGHDDSGNTWHLDGGGALTFLGTGSAIPSKYRNVSGTYLEVMYHARCSTALSRAVVVLDFGEGNAGQLAMLWGNGFAQALLQFFKDLAFVFISHAHADHHLGLVTLLELRHRVRLQLAKQESNDGGGLREPLLVVCPEEVHEFLEDTWGRCAAYRQWLREEVVYDVIPAERHRVSGAPATPVFLPRLNAVCARLDMNTAAPTVSKGDGASPPMWGAEVFPVHHPANAHALLLRFPAPVGASAASRVLLFSGDTRPSPFLIERCRQFARRTRRGNEEGEGDGDGGEAGVFLCLHEATFGEGCEEEAVQKCHSTLPEALGVAAAIRAEHVVLNHFSQRYPKLPGLTKSQLNGRDVDVHCRRRKPRTQDARAALTEPSPPDEAVGLPEGVWMRGTPKREPQDAPSADAGVDSSALKMCFGFDLMRLSFASLESQQAAQLTPLFVQLLEEYESWGVGTTKRLRE